VKAGDHDGALGFHDVEERIRESVQHRSANISPDDGIPLRGGLDRCERLSDRGHELVSQALPALFIPAAGFLDLHRCFRTKQQGTNHPPDSIFLRASLQGIPGFPSFR